MSWNLRKQLEDVRWPDEPTGDLAEPSQTPKARKRSEWGTGTTGRAPGLRTVTLKPMNFFSFGCRRLQSNVEPRRGSKSSQWDRSWQVRRGLKVWFTQDTLETLADPGARGPTDVGADPAGRICSGGVRELSGAHMTVTFHMMVWLNPNKLGWVVQSVRRPTVCGGVWVWFPKVTICRQTLWRSAGELAQILQVFFKIFFKMIC